MILSAGLFYCLFGFATANPGQILIPFYKAGKIIYIQATVNGELSNYIIDTGHDGLLLNSKYFEGTMSSLNLHGINGDITSVQTKIVDLELKSLKINSIRAQLADLSHIEAKKDLKFSGIIGYPILCRYEITFDYNNKELTLNKIDKKGNPLRDDKLYNPPQDSFSFKMKGHLPIIKIKVDDKTLKVGIDSGAESNILSQATLKKIDPHFLFRVKSRIIGIDKATRMATSGNLINISVGKTNYIPMRTLISDFNGFNENLRGPTIDGFIGHEFLVQFKTSINYKKRMVYIWWPPENQRSLPPVSVADEED